jgi:hypothetical protein
MTKKGLQQSPERGKKEQATATRKTRGKIQERESIQVPK